MAKGPENPKEIFPEIIADYKAKFNKELISIILYGSAATDNYRPGRSDINFLIVLSEAGIENLDSAFDVVNKWIKKKVVIPLFLTEKYIETSLDVYPVEYLNFKKNYVLVYGKDVLKDLIIEPKWLRLQCEREIKGKLLLLRTGFLEARGKKALMRELADRSTRSFSAIFTALLFLKDQEVVGGTREVFSKICQLFDLDRSVFLKLLDLRDNNIDPKAHELKELFKAYMNEIRKLAILVDSMEE